MNFQIEKPPFPKCFKIIFMILLLCLCTKVLAFQAEQHNLNENPASFSGASPVRADGLIDQILLDETSRQDDELSICERKEKSSVFAFGKCPETCQVFSVDLFALCAGMVQFGCEMRPCDGANFKCTLKEDLSSDFTVCPGDKVVFDSVELEKLQKVKFSIDLKANPLKTDFYLLSDATGSMSSAIAAAKSKFQNIVDAFSSRPDVAFGVGYYRDENEKEAGIDNGFRNVQALTTNVEAARKAVNTLVAKGGDDQDEANLVALYKVATDPVIGWRERSRKILVYFGDNPGHEPSCVPGLPKLTRDVVVDALNKKKITVIAASFSPGLDNDPKRFGCGSDSDAASGQATRITKGTDGRLVPSSDQSLLVDVITGALKNLSKEFDVDESECKADINSVHNPPLPVTLPPGEKTTVTNTLQVKPSVCEAKGKFECNYKYTESGADLAKTAIELVNIKGCPSS